MTKTCKCGRSFTPKRATGLYCSNACRQKAHRQRQPGTRGIAHLGIPKIRPEYVGSRKVGNLGGLDSHDSDGFSGRTSWCPSDGWWRDEGMLAIKDGTPEDDSHEDVVDPTETYAEAFLFERDKRERREAKTRELARLFRRATLLTIAAAIPRLTSAEFHYLVHETARVFLAWGMPIWMLPGLLQDIYRIAYQEDFVNALVANDLREVIRLEGEKTRAEVRELGNLIVGSVIAREGSVIEAAEEILTGEEGSSV